jgi:hypothetical protein
LSFGIAVPILFLKIGTAIPLSQRPGKQRWLSEYDISELDLSNLPDKIENILNCPITEDDIQLAIRNFK